jgi:hypothetical protein
MDAIATPWTDHPTADLVWVLVFEHALGDGNKQTTDQELIDGFIMLGRTSNVIRRFLRPLRARIDELWHTVDIYHQVRAVRRLLIRPPPITYKARFEFEFRSGQLMLDGRERCTFRSHPLVMDDENNMTPTVRYISFDIRYTPTDLHWPLLLSKTLPIPGVKRSDINVQFWRTIVNGSNFWTAPRTYCDIRSIRIVLTFARNRQKMPSVCTL